MTLSERLIIINVISHIVRDDQRHEFVRIGSEKEAPAASLYVNRTNLPLCSFRMEPSPAWPDDQYMLTGHSRYRMPEDSSSR